MQAQPLIFKDRADAGKQLAAALPPLDPTETVVIALPRGGVPVAAEICAARDLPLDLMLVRKIGAPGQPELAIGAVSDGDTPLFTINEKIARHFDLSPDEIREMGRALLPEIERRRQTYLSDRKALDLSGKTVVVVDDGVATGATLRASLTALKAKNPSQVIVALPVGPNTLADQLDGLADTVICLSDLGHFGAVGGAYRAFPQVADAVVSRTIDEFSPAKSG